MNRIQFSLASILYATTLAGYGIGVSKDFIHALETTDRQNVAQASNLKPGQSTIPFKQLQRETKDTEDIIEDAKSSFRYRHFGEALMAGLIASGAYAVKKTKSKSKDKKPENVNPSS